MRGNLTDYVTSRDTDFTTTIVNGGFDAWKIARQVERYGILPLIGLAMITQGLATSGVAVVVNGFVWQYGMEIVLPLVATAYFTLLGLAFNKAFSQLDTANQAIAVTAAQYI